MQKWRQWEAASEAAWGLAVERKAIIRPLAEQARLSGAAVEDAAGRLQLSRSVLYDLVRRYRATAPDIVLVALEARARDERTHAGAINSWRRGPSWLCHFGPFDRRHRH